MKRRYIALLLTAWLLSIGLVVVLCAPSEEWNEAEADVRIEASEREESAALSDAFTAAEERGYKEGYNDGVLDTKQSSYDKGYRQGLQASKATATASATKP